MIFSSGVDRKTMRYQRLGNGKWAHVDGKSYHKHDVRAITSFESASSRMIVSGGLDRSFSVVSLTDSKENLRVLPPVPQSRVSSVAINARIILGWTDREASLWRIEEISGDQIEKRFLLQMEFNVYSF